MSFSLRCAIYVAIVTVAAAAYVSPIADTVYARQGLSDGVLQAIASHHSYHVGSSNGHAGGGVAHEGNSGTGSSMNRGGRRLRKREVWDDARQTGRNMMPSTLRLQKRNGGFFRASWSRLFGTGPDVVTAGATAGGKTAATDAVTAAAAAGGKPVPDAVNAAAAAGGKAAFTSKDKAKLFIVGAGTGAAGAVVVDALTTRARDKAQAQVATNSTVVQPADSFNQGFADSSTPHTNAPIAGTPINPAPGSVQLHFMNAPNSGFINVPYAGHLTPALAATDTNLVPNTVIGYPIAWPGNVPSTTLVPPFPPVPPNQQLVGAPIPVPSNVPSTALFPPVPPNQQLVGAPISVPSNFPNAASKSALNATPIAAPNAQANVAPVSTLTSSSESL